MPTYEVPDIVEVALDDLELPANVPVDEALTVKPISDCTKGELDEAVRTFSGLVRQSQTEIEASIEKHIEFRRRVAHLQAYRENFDDIDWVRRHETGA
jgi:hypothetical protein